MSNFGYKLLKQLPEILSTDGRTHTQLLYGSAATNMVVEYGVMPSYDGVRASSFFGPMGEGLSRHASWASDKHE